MFACEGGVTVFRLLVMADPSETFPGRVPPVVVGQFGLERSTPKAFANSSPVVGAKRQPWDAQSCANKR